MTDNKPADSQAQLLTEDEAATPPQPAAAEKVAGAVQTTAQAAAQAAQTVTETVQTTAQQATEKAQQVTEVARQVTEVTQARAEQATVPVPVARQRGRIFLWIALAALGAFGLLAYLVHGHRHNPIDLRITQAVRAQQRTRPWLASYLRLVSLPGFAPWSWLGPVVAAGLLRWSGYRLESGFVLGTGVANAIVSVIKIIVARPRPSDPTIDVHAALEDYSFPSGHTIQYAAQYGFGAYLAYSLLRQGPLRNGLLALLSGLIALVGPSRIAMGQHWASDVLASYCLGTAYLLGHIGLYRRFKGRQVPVAPNTSRTIPLDEALGRLQRDVRWLHGGATRLWSGAAGATGYWRRPARATVGAGAVAPSAAVPPVAPTPAGSTAAGSSSTGMPG